MKNLDPTISDDIIIAKKYLQKCRNAKQRKIPFELTFNDYKRICKVNRCFYTRAILNNIYGDPNKKTLDRKDNSKGYTKENTVVCAFWLNQKKADLTLQEIKYMAKALPK